MFLLLLAGFGIVVLYICTYIIGCLVAPKSLFKVESQSTMTVSMILEVISGSMMVNQIQILGFIQS